MGVFWRHHVGHQVAQGVQNPGGQALGEGTECEGGGKRRCLGAGGSSGETECRAYTRQPTHPFSWIQPGSKVALLCVLCVLQRDMVSAQMKLQQLEQDVKKTRAECESRWAVPLPLWLESSCNVWGFLHR